MYDQTKIITIFFFFYLIEKQLITSELTPTYASSSVGAVATGVNWAMNFLIGQIFPVIFEAISGYSFVIFAAVCFFAFWFTFFMLPESKNRSIENIVRGFEHNNHHQPDNNGAKTVSVKDTVVENI